jgi:hypothetical protein
MILTALCGCSGSGESGDQLSSKSKSMSKLEGSDIVVSNSLDDQSNPRIVFLPDKNLYFAVWDDNENRNSTGTDIYGRFIDREGNVCKTATSNDKILLSKDALGALANNQTLPDVAYRQDKTDSALSLMTVVWQDTVASVGEVRYANITNIPTLTAAQTCGPTTVTKTNTTLADPTVSNALSMNYNHLNDFQNGKFTDTATFIIQAGKNNGTATLTSYVVPRSVHVTGSYIDVDTGLTVNVNATDDGAGEFTGSGVGNGNLTSVDIDYQKGAIFFGLKGNTLNAETFTVTYDRFTGQGQDHGDRLLSRKSPRISYDQIRQEFWVSWLESRTRSSFASVMCFGAPFTFEFGDADFIGYARVDKDGATLKTNALGFVGADILRNDARPSSYSQFPAAFTASTHSNKLIASSKGADFEIYKFEFFTDVNNPVVASDTSSPETLLAWEGQRFSSEIECRIEASGKITAKNTIARDGDGAVGTHHIYGAFDKSILSIQPALFIDNENATFSSSNPSVAVDDASTPRKFLVAWEDNRGGPNTKVFGQLINSGSTLYNFNRMLSFQDSTGGGTNDAVITNSRQTRPFVTYDAVNQRYFVIWQDERNSSASIANIDLYGQYVNLEGSLSGTNYSISSNSSNQLAPSIAYDPLFKQFLAVWKDARNITSGTTASDIYGQRFSLGQPQMTILTATTPPVQLVPAVIDFGAVNTGLTVTRNIVIKNTGDAPLVINPITLLPANPFSVTPTNGVNLAPGASTTYTVTYQPTSSGSYNSSFTISSDGGSQVIALSASGVGVNTLAISSPSSPTMTLDNNFSVQMVATGGFTPFTWSQTGLPTELQINSSTGLISPKVAGVGPALGTYNVTITVADGSAIPVKASRNYTLTVGTIDIDITPLSDWTQGVDYLLAPVHVVTASGGTGTLTWLIAAGAGTPPPGITPVFRNHSAIFGGIASGSGQYSFTLKVTDSAAIPETAQQTFSININPQPAILTTSLNPGVIAQPYFQTMSLAGGTQPIVWSYTGGLPPGLSFNPASGTISGTPTAANATPTPFTVTATDATGASDSQQLSIIVDPVVGINTPAGPLAAATLNSPYQQTLNANGTGLYSWSVKPGFGVLPTGLALGANTGQISGTPTEAGLFSFQIELTDVFNNKASKTFSILVSTTGGTNIAIIGTPSSGTINSPYEFTFSPSGGIGPYIWNIKAGTLPTGLAMNSNTGKISGTCTETGTFSFQLELTDVNNNTISGTYSIIVNSATGTGGGGATVTILTPVPGSGNLPGGAINALYEITLNATGGAVPYKWALKAGALPTGLSLNANTGKISGTPTETGKFSYVIEVADINNNLAVQTFTIDIQASAGALITIFTPDIGVGSPPDARIGTPYEFTFNPGGGVAPYTWAIKAGVLPTGLTLNANTGKISGTCTVTGAFSFVLEMTDVNKSVATKTFTINVLPFDGPALAIATPASGNGAPVNGVINKTYSFTLIASGGASPYTWKVIAGSLPSGLVLSAATGKISGTCTELGTFSFVAEVTDVNNTKAIKTFTITVTPQLAAFNIQKTGGTGTVNSSVSVSPFDLLGTPGAPLGFNPNFAGRFSVTGAIAGDTAVMAVTFPAIPANAVFYSVSGTNWIPIIPDSISGTTVTYKVKDRTTTADTDSLAQRDDNPAFGIIEDTLVVGVTLSGAGGGGTNVPPASSSSNGGGGCFIATAAYGSYLDPHVMVLRNFRDNVLLQSTAGTAFVKYYYKYSPPVADFIREHYLLRVATRLLLTPLIVAVKYPFLVPLTLFAALALFWRRIRKYTASRLICRQH